MIPTLLTFLILTVDSGASAAVSAADRYYAAINYDEAIATCERALTTAPGNPDLLWRLARTLIAMGEVAEGERREKMFRAAEESARRCVEVDSLLPEGHTWLAAALGNIASYEGSKTKVRLANQIRQHLDIALALNPDDDVALSILGSFHRALGNVSWLERQLAAIFLGNLPEGGYEESERALNRAIVLAPRVIRHRFELALLYIDWDKPDLARPVLETCLTLPVLVASDRPTLVKTREMLDDLR